MKQVIALGGGGFSMEPDNPLLDEYIMRQSAARVPKICFIGTASGDADGYIDRFYQFFNQYDCEPTHLSLFKPPCRDLESFILAQDILYVGGGSTKNLMALWREWGLVDILKKAYDQGVLLCGISAGAICWFEMGVTDSYGGELEPVVGTGILQGSHSPHYNEEEKRRPAYQQMIKEGVMMGGMAASDGTALHYVNGELHRIVSSRPEARAYEVTPKGETMIEPYYLGQDYVLKSKRLTLKPFTQADFNHLISWIDSEEQMTIWSGSTFTFPLTDKQLAAYQADKKQVAFSVYSNETGDCIGHIAIGKINQRHRSARIGKVLIGTPALRAKGLGEEMMREAVTFAFSHLDLHKVTLGVYEHNKRAIACYERIGFQKEGLLRDHARVGKGYWNMWEMCLLQDDYV